MKNPWPWVRFATRLYLVIIRVNKMDLREIKESSKTRHPWETSRVVALRSVLKETIKGGLKVLDIGCGDGYAAREIFRDTGVKDITGVDINLTKEQISGLTRLKDGIQYRNTFPPEKEKYGLILLLDVIEHTADDMTFLSETVKKRLSAGGRVLITVPAFMSLYGPHDEYLSHYRRYSLKELKTLANRAGLRVVSSGYLYTLLLPARFFSLAAGKVLRLNPRNEGVGGWRGPGSLTSLVDLVLRADNRVSLTLNRLGIILPGLTGWALCEKQP